MGGDENDGLFICVRAACSEAVILVPASKSSCYLNPHNSRGRGTLLALLSWTHSKSNQEHLEQISQSAAITGCALLMCRLLSDTMRTLRTREALFQFLCITSAHNPVKGRQEDQGMKKE